MVPSSPGGRGSSVDVLSIASSGPTDTPDVPAFSRRYVDGGDVIGMHSVIPYDGSTCIGWKGSRGGEGEEREVSAESANIGIALKTPERKSKKRRAVVGEIGRVIDWAPLIAKLQ